MDALVNLRNCARPVVFDTGVAIAPYSITGTSFLVGFGDRVYVLTARHVVRDLPANRILIFPTDDAASPLRVAAYHHLPVLEDAPDRNDLVLMNIDIGNLSAKSGQARLIDLSHHTSDWFSQRASAKFYFCGYPVEQSSVDYSSGHIRNMQYFLTATFIGPSIDSECYELAFENPCSLTDLNGMSGSPVYCHSYQIAVATEPKFCGMLLRGTVASGRVHFLDARRIVSVLEDARAA